MLQGCPPGGKISQTSENGWETPHDSASLTPLLSKWVYPPDGGAEAGAVLRAPCHGRPWGFLTPKLKILRLLMA